MNRKITEEEVKACEELYIKYRGRRHRQIEVEMRAGGWPEFSRRIMYRNVARGIEYGGWIRRFGWEQKVEQLTRETEEREAGRTTFEDWLQTEPSGLKWTARHHAFICERLRLITEGTSKRLMIFLPPRHGKSELVTVRYIAWRLIRNARMNVIIGCYNQKLANRFSRKIKEITTGRVIRSHQRHAAEEWETAPGGSVKAVGVGSGITGFGGDLVVIDDPVKSRAAANSRNFRDKTWDWYKDDISTRLEPGAAVILIQTRWHDDDLAGRLLKDMEAGGEQWDVVLLPALSEGGADMLGRAQGKSLWPERFAAETLHTIKGRLGSRSFSALYQQRPQPAGGTVFKLEWFARRVSKVPGGLRWMRGYDLAVSLKDSADYTASFRCALDKKTGDLYIADGFRKRVEYPEQRQYVIERLAAEPTTGHGIESALHGTALVQDLLRDPRTAGRSLRSVKVDGDKLIRAEAWASRAEQGHIVLVNGPWVDDFLDEVSRFTGRGDAHDDQVDAVSLACQMLNTRKGAIGF